VFYDGEDGKTWARFKPADDEPWSAAQLFVATQLPGDVSATVHTDGVLAVLWSDGATIQYRDSTGS
jgi:hypothetical protein